MKVQSRCDCKSILAKTLSVKSRNSAPCRERSSTLGRGRFTPERRGRQPGTASEDPWEFFWRTDHELQRVVQASVDRSGQPRYGETIRGTHRESDQAEDEFAENVEL